MGDFCDEFSPSTEGCGEAGDPATVTPVRERSERQMKKMHTAGAAVIASLALAAPGIANEKAETCFLIPPFATIPGTKPTDCFSAQAWNDAVTAYNASSRVEFKSDWSKHVIKALRAYEAGQ